MKVALVHPWLVIMGGAERVLEQLCALFPTADIFTHVVDPAILTPALRCHRIKSSFIQKLPLARKYYRRYLPLMPMALEQLDVRDYDLIISGEYAPAKGVIASPDAVHICYCHTPMRYLWNMYYEHWESRSALGRLLMPPVAHYLRIWDQLTADRVDQFVANSQNTRRRISRYYRKDAAVIYPPVPIEDFTPSASDDGFYLMVSRLVGYKRVDLAVEAFNQLGLPLVVIGRGPERARLERLAQPNVRLLGEQNFAVLRQHYSRCKAVIFPGEEDFGIVPVEAMASGKPVVAFGRGGALETVIPGVSGVHFGEQTADALAAAVLELERRRHEFVTARIVAHAQRFSVGRFHLEMRRLVKKALAAGGISGEVEQPMPTSAPAASLQSEHAGS